MSREQELRKAVKQARLLPRDFRTFVHLLDKADWQTAIIPDSYQPRSTRILAGECETSLHTMMRSLAHLESHGWLARTRDASGRGYRTTYALLLGSVCECQKPGRPKRVNSGTLPPDLQKGPRITQKGPRIDTIRVPELTQEGSQNYRENRRSDVVFDRGSKEGQRGGELEEGAQTRVIPLFRAAAVRLLAMDACGICETTMHPVLAGHGYKTHPCCDPDEKVAGLKPIAWPGAA